MRISAACLSALLGLGLAVPQPISGQDEAVQSGATFLLIPVGGRAAALGQAAVADWGTTESVFWNPAGLAPMNQGEIAIHHAQTFVSNNTVVSAFFPSGIIGGFGVTAYLVDFGSQEVVRPGGPQTGRISPKNVELIATYATNPVGQLFLGVNYKLIQFRQDCAGDCGFFPDIAGTTHGLDFGLQYAVGEGGPLRLGAALKHAGFKLQLENREQADPLPTRLQFGIVYRIDLSPPAPDASPLDLRFLFDIENEWSSFDDPDLRVGMELGYGELVRLRTGYASIDQVFEGANETEGARGPSVGIGVKLGRFAVDFSRVFFDTSNLDEPVYISLRAGL